MDQVLEVIGYFATGWVLGYFWYPFWHIVKKIVNNAIAASRK